MQIDTLNKSSKYASTVSKKSDKSWNFIYGNWKVNIVKDINAPQLYSRQVINIFSIIFSVLFGGILLAINLKSINNKKAILPVLAYSIIYTGLLTFIGNLLGGNTTGLLYSFNLMGTMVLSNFFWGKYIGKEFQYRTKSFWVPMVIGIVIFIILIWARFAGR